MDFYLQEGTSASNEVTGSLSYLGFPSRSSSHTHPVCSCFGEGQRYPILLGETEAGAHHRMWLSKKELSGWCCFLSCSVPRFASRLALTFYPLWHHVGVLTPFTKHVEEEEEEEGRPVSGGSRSALLLGSGCLEQTSLPAPQVARAE